MTVTFLYIRDLTQKKPRRTVKKFFLETVKVFL